MFILLIPSLGDFRPNKGEEEKEENEREKKEKEGGRKKEKASIWRRNFSMSIGLGIWQQWSRNGPGYSQRLVGTPK